MSEWNTSIGEFRLTLARNIALRVKLLEYQHIVFALLAHVVETLLGIVLQVQCRTCIMSSNMVRLDQIGLFDSSSITDR